jgi:hypothetical protein
MGAGSTRNRVVAVVAGFAFLLVGAAGARANPVFTGACDACSGTYSGTYVEHDVEPDTSGIYDVTTDVNITWSQNIVDNHDMTGTASAATVSGAYTVTSNQPGFQSSTCTVSLDPNAGPSVSWSYKSPSAGGPDYDNFVAEMPNEVDLAGSGPCNGGHIADPVNGVAIVPNANGSSPSWAGTGCHWGNNGGLILTTPGGSPYTVTDDCTFQTTGSNGGTSDVTATDSLNWTSSGTASPTGPTTPTLPVGSLGPQLKRAKHLARGDLIRTIDRSEVYCVSFAAGGGLVGSGILLSGVGGGAGITFTVAGGLITAALNPLCGPAIARGIVDYKTYHDPPLSSIHVLARPATVRPPKLPACPSGAGACSSLRSALSALDAAALNCEADAAAIEQTVSREHAALLAGNQGAATTQDKHLAPLNAALVRSQHAETSAGKAVASALKRAHLAFNLSRAQSARLLARVKRGFVAGGVTAAQVLSVDPSAFTAAATNLLRVL